MGNWFRKREIEVRHRVITRLYTIIILHTGAHECQVHFLVLSNLGPRFIADQWKQFKNFVKPVLTVQKGVKKNCTSSYLPSMKVHRFWLRLLGHARVSFV